ncbi:NfeD family protein [Sphaerospermopsis sp. LEGE 08334]|jgi:membrane protein implicated in regulation of membrane protease activity|uniref:NfeD family protein n=1 Tax=Sphaerospermopsis sp. LEGE 08334 TaxID=1828651 RepID=UPI00187E874D|nr:NfeD family protein [Sphaerospermopsis sp. LEGE 08334]MBE9057056.1 NfeD family protein [Sphaerospermopsis sp. LEGE 08334]
MPTFTLIWLVVGIVLCLMELLLPTAFVEFMMGISAFAVALLSYLGLSSLWLQVILWLLLSTVLVVFSRRFLQPPTRRSKISDAVIGETLTEILPGQAGRVLYEGNSWRARCDDDKLSLAPGQKVYVVSREGTTLIVMPENILR